MTDETKQLRKDVDRLMKIFKAFDKEQYWSRVRVFRELKQDIGALEKRVRALEKRKA